MANEFKEFTVGFTVTSEVEMTVRAIGFAEAIEVMKSQKFGDLLQTRKGVSLNDDSVRIRSVSVGEWLNGE